MTPGGFTEGANEINKSGTTDSSSVVSRGDRAARATVDRQNVDLSDEDEDNEFKALADGCDVAGASQSARWRGGRVYTRDLPFLQLLVRTQVRFPTVALLGVFSFEDANASGGS